MSAAAQRLAHTRTGTQRHRGQPYNDKFQRGEVEERRGQQHPKGHQKTTEFQSGRQQRPPPARRRLALAALTVANASNFWQRNLIYALASVIPPQCLKECENAAFVPVCDVCDADECEECQTC